MTIRESKLPKRSKEQKKIAGQLETRSCQTETETTTNSTQTNSSGEQKSDDKIWVSRVDPTKTIQEKRRHNEAPPKMTKNTSLEASHELITEGLIATLEKATNTTEAEEDTPSSGRSFNGYWECVSLPQSRKKTATSAHSLILLERGIGRPIKRHMDLIGITSAIGSTFAKFVC